MRFLLLQSEPLAFASLGSVIALSNNDGVAEQYQYDAFGNTKVYEGLGALKSDISQLIGNPYMFTGRRLDPETFEATPDSMGLYYYRARMYNPQLGRFMQPDPIGYYDAMNLYQYCGNNPVNWVDPWGLVAVVGDPYNPATSIAAAGWMSAQEAGAALAAGAQQTGTAALSLLAQAGIELTVWQKIGVLFFGVTISDVIGLSGGGSTGPNNDGTGNGGGNKDCQDKQLSPDEIKKLKDAGEDIHKLKQDILGRNAKLSKYDLYKNGKGDIFLKPKGGAGMGEPTGLNINNF